MSAWPIPDEVVEAVAAIGCRCAPGGCAAHGCEECRAAARDFLERHRLVVLPKEPDAYVVESKLGRQFMPYPTLAACEWGLKHAMSKSVPGARLLCAYLSPPGQPITVDKEESDGDE